MCRLIVVFLLLSARLVGSQPLKEFGFHDETSMLQVGQHLKQSRGMTFTDASATPAHTVIMNSQSHGSHWLQHGMEEPAAAASATMDTNDMTTSIPGFLLEPGLCRNKNAAGSWDVSLNGAYCMKRFVQSLDCRSACSKSVACRAAGWIYSTCDTVLADGVARNSSSFLATAGSDIVTDENNTAQASSNRWTNLTMLDQLHATSKGYDSKDNAAKGICTHVYGDTRELSPGAPPVRIDPDLPVQYCYLFTAQAAITNATQDCPEGFTAYNYTGPELFDVKKFLAENHNAGDYSGQNYQKYVQSTQGDTLKKESVNELLTSFDNLGIKGVVQIAKEEAKADDIISHCYIKEKISKCEDNISNQNFCSEWCNRDHIWPGCGSHTLHGFDIRNVGGKDYTCTCEGCNGCSLVKDTTKSIGDGIVTSTTTVTTTTSVWASFHVQSGICRNRNSDLVWDVNVLGAYCARTLLSAQECGEEGMAL
jgi:hypothetical protein